MWFYHVWSTPSLLSTKVEILDPVKVRYRYWPKAKRESILRDPWGHCSSFELPPENEMNQRPKKTSLYRHSKEALTCLLCSFRVSLAATSFNALVRPRELHRRVSGHLQRCPAIWKCNKIMRKHLEKWLKKQRIFRLKTTCGVWAACFVSYSLLVPALAVLLSSTTLTFVLNQSLAESSTGCANLFYIWHFQQELSN